MQLGMIGLGRMGANMVRRLMAGGHECVVFDASPEQVHELAQEGATGSVSLDDLVERLAAPRAVWLMVPAPVVGDVTRQLATRLSRDDVIVDGGNSRHVDAPRRAAELAHHGIHFVDVGTSGGVWGRKRGYCLMVGGDPAPVDRLMPVLRTLSPSASTDGGRRGEGGLLHCGPSGAGHFVKMVHNGIEYALMQAYAEGLNVLDGAESPYDFDLPAIAEVWRHGSVIESWLLDLLARALSADPRLEQFTGTVSDSGEGRWMLQAAVDQGTPVPALATALFARFSSRGEADVANRVLSALRKEFGGHVEPPSA